MVMLVHHSSESRHPLFLTTSNGSYDVRKIKESLSETQKSYLLFSHAFTGCDTVSTIAGAYPSRTGDEIHVGNQYETYPMDLRARLTR